MNKSIKILIGLFIGGSISISCILGQYIFTKSASTNAQGSANIVNRTYQYPDIILKAGYKSPTCVVTDGQGNDVTQDYVKNYFVESEDVTDEYRNHFVQLKKYYVNMSQDSSGVITYNISKKKLDETYFVNPYFKDEDGNEIDYAYYGKYKGYVTGDKLCSISGVTPTYSTTIDNFRTYARNNGKKYHQTDWCAVYTAQIMFMCVYKTTNINTAITTYRTNGCATGEGTELLGIEDLVGNGFEYVDGVVYRTYGADRATSTVSYADKISDYAEGITTNQTTLTGATGATNKYISKMYYSEGQPALSIFPKANGGTASTYYCDSMAYSGNTQANLVYWGAHKQLDGRGLFYTNAEDTWSVTHTYTGSRLHKKGLTETSMTLKAGYSDASCSVLDSNGNDVTQDFLTKFFVATNEDGTSALDVTDSYNNHFVKLKKYYVNMSQDSSGVITYKLCNIKKDSSYFVCPYFYDKDGNEIDYAYYGKYKGYVNTLSSKLRSISGVSPTGSTSIGAFRTCARNNGDQYHQTDWCAAFAAQIMFMCYYKTTNTLSKYTIRTSQNTGSGTQILGIEDLVGNYYEFLDGVIFSNHSGSSNLSDCIVYWADKISDYSNSISTNATQLTNATGTISDTVTYYSAKYCENGEPALSIFPKNIGTGSSSSYYCGWFSFHDYTVETSIKSIVCWGTNSSKNGEGIFSIGTGYNTNFSMISLGSRLHAKYLS